MKVQKHKICYYFVVLIIIISSIADSLHCINQNCYNTENDFPSAKKNQVLLIFFLTFPVEDNNSKQKKVGSVE